GAGAADLLDAVGTAPGDHDLGRGAGLGGRGGGAGRVRGPGVVDGHRTAVLRTSQSRPGAPSTAVMIPTWISEGGMTMRPRVSVSSTSTGPTIALPSRMRR